jgi:hypothetical protein
LEFETPPTKDNLLDKKKAVYYVETARFKHTSKSWVFWVKKPKQSFKKQFTVTELLT